jgi:hypothetical protein
MSTNKATWQAFGVWAKEHLGQGYSLEMEDHTYVCRVTRWAFVSFRAQQKIIDELQRRIDMYEAEEYDRQHGGTRMSNLRDSFEAWANSYYHYPHANGGFEIHGGVYIDEDLEDAWQAYQAAHTAALNSLCVGVDCLDDGDAISLISRAGGIYTVLAAGHTKAGGSSFHKVTL